MALTAKKRAYARARLAGCNKREAAIEAGYSATSASSKGAQLEKDPDVQQFLAVLQNGGEGDAHLPLMGSALERELKALESIDDPLEALKLIWKSPHIDLKTRVDAMKSALPYTNKKLGETGKKEARTDDAKQKTDSGKFGTLGSQMVN